MPSVFVPPVVTDANFTVRSRARVRLGPLLIDLFSNEEQFVGLHYFPRASATDAEVPADYTLAFCNLNADGPWSHAAIRRQQDRHYRARRFAVGYYITDHFGAPAHLFTHGTHYWIVGENFESILWPYFAKLLLTLYSIGRGLVHVKAAAVAIDGAGTLLVGRGGGGKTVLLTQLCRNGAQFLSNTHSLLGERTITPAKAAIRVRDDALFGPIIRERGLRAGIKSDEYLVDPLADLGWRAASTATLKNVCLVDYRGRDECEIREMDRAVLLEYMEQFSLALNVYGLKEDVFDHLGGDFDRFAACVSSMKNGLRDVLALSRVYYVSCDAMVPRHLDALRDRLAN